MAAFDGLEPPEPPHRLGRASILISVPDQVNEQQALADYYAAAEETESGVYIVGPVLSGDNRGRVREQ